MKPKCCLTGSQLASLTPRKCEAFQTFMSTKKPKSLQQLVTENLGSLAERASQMDQITHEIRAVLPQPLGEHVIAVNLRDETVVVVTDSPVWASRIRFYSSIIVTRINESPGSQVANLSVKVRAPQVPDR